jgi:hypothetical protein
MQMEYFILTAMWVLGITGFILFIPREKKRKGILTLMIFQAIIWLCDMPAFTYNLLSAPVRFFPKATDLTVTINYLFYPVLFSIYYVHKRRDSSLTYKVMYFLVWVSFLTLIDIVLERHTDLLEYGRITAFGMWLYIGFIVLVSQIFCNWFYKEKEFSRIEGSEPNDY